MPLGNSNIAGPLIPPVQWWERRRLRYNLWLVAAIVAGGFTALVIMDAFEATICAPLVDEQGNVIGYDNEVGGLAVLAPCGGAILGIGLANLCFSLLALGEKLLKPSRVASYRVWAWRLGLGFSCLLPFSVALFHLVCCLFFPQWYDRTPVVVRGPDGG